LRSRASAVFINYRRADSGPSAGRLFDRLAAHLGSSGVFMDVYAITPGEDWTAAIDRGVANCQLFLALIGPRWLTAEVDGRRRIDDPTDLVRLEIESAFRHGLPIIPVLLEDARMPDPVDLPAGLAALPQRQALRLRQESYQADADRLLAAVDRTLAVLPTAGETTAGEPTAGKGGPEPANRHRRAVVAATLALLAAAVAGMSWWLTLSGSSPSAPPSPAATTSGRAPAPLTHAERTAVVVVDGFWQRHFTAETGLPYTPPVLAGPTPGACGGQSNQYVIFYCSPDDAIVWNEDQMQAAFARQGMAWLYLSIAHQWGNSVQRHLGRDIQFERADCLAGAALQGAVDDGELAPGDLQKVVELLPVVYGVSHPQSPDQFRTGAAGGVAACL
jgi:hypothetical protein